MLVFLVGGDGGVFLGLQACKKPCVCTCLHRVVTSGENHTRLTARSWHSGGQTTESQSPTSMLVCRLKMGHLNLCPTDIQGSNDGVPENVYTLWREPSRV